MTWSIPLPRSFVILGLIFYYPAMGAYYIIGCPFLAYEKYQKHKQKKPTRVRPLPCDRKRSLTLPLSESYSPWYRKGWHQKTFDQSQSPFFRLPRELRDIIYHQVIVPSNGADIHVGIMGHRLCGIICGESDFSRQGWKHNCWKPTNRSGYSIEHLDPSHSHSRGFFGLLQSCRKMLVTLLLLYATVSTV